MELCKCLVDFNVILLLLLSDQRIIIFSIAKKLIPFDTFNVSDTVEIMTLNSHMNVQMSCQDEEFINHLLKTEPVDLLRSNNLRTDCIIPESKYLTVVPSRTDSVKLTIHCEKNCLKKEGDSGEARYRENCNSGEYEILNVQHLFSCNFRDQKEKVHCFKARNVKDGIIIVATSIDSQYVFLSSKFVKDGAPKLITLAMTMNLDKNQPMKVDNVTRYRYHIPIQVLPYVFNKSCEMKPQSGFQQTLYTLSCKDLSAYSQNGNFFFSLSYKGLDPYIKQDEKLGESLEASFKLPSTTDYHVDVKLYVYSVKNGKKCMEILSTFRYTVKPPISYGSLGKDIDEALLFQDVGKVKNATSSITSDINKHSENFNEAYSFYSESEKEEGLKNLINLRLKLLTNVFRLQTDRAQNMQELSTLMDDITKNKREFDATGKIVCGAIYSNFASQLKEQATSKTKEAFDRDARYLVSGVSDMLNSYEVEPRFKMTAEEKNNNIQMSIDSVNKFLSVIDTISTAISSVDQTSSTTEIRSPLSVLNVIKPFTPGSNVCDNPVDSTLESKSHKDIFMKFKCQPENDTSEEKPAFLSTFLIYNNPYDLAESLKPNYPVLSVRAYKDNAEHIDIGPKYISVSHPKVPVDLQWKKFILKFDFRREGNFLYPDYSRKFLIPTVTLNSPYSSNHYIFINLDKRSFHLDVAVHVTQKLPFKKFVSGDFERLPESRVSNTNFVNYTVLVPVGSIKEDIYFLIIKPFKNYTITDEMGKMQMMKTKDKESNTEHTESVEHVEIPMHFGIMSKTCLNWNDKDNMWSGRHCKMLNSSMGFNQLVECSCEQSNMLSARFFIPPNIVHPIDDAHLFTEIFTNPIMLSVVLLAWVIYIGLLHLTKRLDWRDRESSSLTVLSNNLAGYVYLVCVKTKWWIGSGTTARVYLVLMGDGVHSSVVYLRDSHKRCFQSGEANWFLLTTETGIGDIKQILIWHDNSGSSPDWKLDYVTIQDLQTKVLWLFILSDWMSSNRGLFLTYVYLKPLHKNQEQYLRWKMFQLEVLDCFRRTHQWFSYIFTPPSSFTRAQRLTCTFSLLLALMLGNIMFYKVPLDQPKRQVTLGSVTISVTSLIIGLQTSLVIIPLGLIVTQLFIQVKPKSHDYLIGQKKKKTLKPEIKQEGREKMAEDHKEKQYTENKTGSYTFWIHNRPCLNQKTYSILQNLIGEENNSRGSRPPGTSAKVRPKKDTAADDGHQHSTAEQKKDELEKEKEMDSVYLEHPANTDNKYVEKLPKTGVPVDRQKYEKGKNQEDSNAKDKYKKFRHLFEARGLLPWWFVYISWAITLTFCLISTYFIMLYGFKYGYEMSIDWCVAFLTSLFQSIFLEQPFEILFQTALAVFVRMKPSTEVFSNSMINKNENDFLLRIHEICYYEGNCPFAIHLPVQAKKKTENSPKHGPEKNLAKA